MDFGAFQFLAEWWAELVPPNETMQTFHYEPCLPECNYDNSIPIIPRFSAPVSAVLLLASDGPSHWDKTPAKMPELRNMPELEEPPPLVFGTETVAVKKKIKRVKQRALEKEEEERETGEGQEEMGCSCSGAVLAWR